MSLGMTVVEQSLDERIPSLKFLALRSASKQLFAANSSSHKVRNGNKYLSLPSCSEQFQSTMNRK